MNEISQTQIAINQTCPSCKNKLIKFDCTFLENNRGRIILYACESCHPVRFYKNEELLTTINDYLKIYYETSELKPNPELLQILKNFKNAKQRLLK